MESIKDYLVLMNDFSIRIEDSKIYYAGGNKGYYSLFTKGALLKMREAIDNTLEAYDSLD